MSTSLKHRLNDLASSFASNVLAAIRGASLDELLAEAPGKRGQSPLTSEAAVGAGRRRTGRLPRRSTDDIEQVIESIVGLLRQSPKGLRAEQIRQKLGLESKELPRPLKEALDAGRLGKSGQKRATTYFVKGAGGAGASSSANGGRKAKGATKTAAKKASGRRKGAKRGGRRGSGASVAQA